MTQYIWFGYQGLSTESSRMTQYIWLDIIDIKEPVYHSILGMDIKKLSTELTNITQYIWFGYQEMVI
jgi:hypothetical protein